MIHGEAAPYIRLWCNVIIQAIADIEEQCKQRYLKAKCEKSRGTVQYRVMVQLTNEATEWIESTANHIGSFEWICDHCDLDREKIRDLSRSREGRKTLLQSSARRNKERRKTEQTTDGNDN